MDNIEIVEKLIFYIDKISAYCSGMDYDHFSENSMLVDACILNLGQMGEIVKKVSKNFEYAHDNIPWRTLYGLRNKIFHDYDGINYTLIWEIITEDLPVLKKLLLEILQGC